MTERPPISFIAWAREDSRSKSLSRALDGEFCTFFDFDIQSRPLVPLRYLASALRTLTYLILRRPRAVVIQSPPVPAAALVWGWARLARVPVVLDTHPASFEETGVHQVMRPLIRWLVPRASGCIVTTPRLGDQITRWGGRPVIVHEAPMVWSDRMRPSDRSAQRRVLFICTFAPDEPLMQVLDAARRLPEVEFHITGDRRRLPPAAAGAAPANVHWTGYLRGDDYVDALGRADVIMSLTTRAESVQRSAYEAVDALRPLVVSDWPHMRSLFPHAVFVTNDGQSIAAGVSEALVRWQELSGVVEDARVQQWQRWDRQLHDLGVVVGDTELVTAASPVA
ncbi:MAG TPA: glycosyltransferase [Solirubrobacteraceae bacterium]|nr:glycosyltransferase [Solirubrobacteraceae bacterium]